MTSTVPRLLHGVDDSADERTLAPARTVIASSSSTEQDPSLRPMCDDPQKVFLDLAERHDQVRGIRGERRCLLRPPGFSL